MFKKLLFLIWGAKESPEILEKVVELAKSLNSEIIAFNVIDLNIVRNLTKELQKREAEVLVDLEEDGWKYLYHLEDLAKEKGVKILLVQEEGILESEILKAYKKFGADIIILPKYTGSVFHYYTKIIEDILKKLDCSILVI